MRFATLLRHGVLAGAAAGLAAAVLLWLAVEPVIRRALVVEEAREADHAHEHGEVVSRAAQVLGGLATAELAGVMVGVVFAVVFARLRHRLPGDTDVARSAWLSLAGFGAITLLPALVVPANPPAVGDPDTVTQRTLTWLLVVVLGLLVAGLVLALDHRLAARDAGTRALAAAAVAVGGAAVVLLAVPDVADRVPADVPATLLWDFRVASLAQLGAMWLVLGLVHGALVARTAAREGRPEPAPATA